MATNKPEKLLPCPFDPEHIVPLGSYQRHIQEECEHIRAKKDVPPSEVEDDLHSAENWAKKLVNVTVVDPEVEERAKSHDDNNARPAHHEERPARHEEWPDPNDCVMIKYYYMTLDGPKVVRFTRPVRDDAQD